MMKALLPILLMLPICARAQIFNYEQVNGIELGQSLDQLANQYPSIQVPESTKDSACFYIVIPEITGVQWMILDGIVARANLPISANSPTMPVIMDFVSGQLTPDQVANRYTNLQIDNHEYHEGYRVTFYNTLGDRAVVADYVNNNVENLRVGLILAAMFIEGCA